MVPSSGPWKGIFLITPYSARPPSLPGWRVPLGPVPVLQLAPLALAVAPQILYKPSTSWPCHFIPADEDSMFLQNVGIDLRNHMAPKPKTAFKRKEANRSLAKQRYGVPSDSTGQANRKHIDRYSQSPHSTLMLHTQNNVRIKLCQNLGTFSCNVYVYHAIHLSWSMSLQSHKHVWADTSFGLLPSHLNFGQEHNILEARFCWQWMAVGSIICSYLGSMRLANHPGMDFTLVSVDETTVWLLKCFIQKMGWKRSKIHQFNSTLSSQTYRLMICILLGTELFPCQDRHQ
jgi:hypothetical protein